MLNRRSVLLAGLGAGCAKPPRRVSIAAFQGATFVLLMQSLGYWKDEGLDVTVDELAGDVKSAQALVGGSADVIFAAFETAVLLGLEGQAARAFSIIGNRLPLALVVSPKASKVLRSVADLPGAKVEVANLGDPGHNILRYLLLKNGMAPDAAEAIATGAGAPAIAVIEQGRVDAGIVLPGALVMLKARYPGLTVLADFNGAADTRRVFGVDAYPTVSFIALERFLNEQPDTAARLARGARRGLDWLHKASPEEIRARKPAAAQLPDRNAEREGVRILAEACSKDGRMPPGGPAAVVEYLKFANERARAAGSIDAATSYREM